MLDAFFKKIFGTKHLREVKALAPIVEQIKALEPRVQALSDEQLKAKTLEFRGRLKQGQKLDDLLVEAFACVREASQRTIKLRHYDVQMVGGIVLHRGRIAEMKTGEGKTLAATLSLYLNGLEGKGAHLVTVNDYLADRDSKWMGPIFEALGMRVGIIVHGLEDPERREAYRADVTYGTNNEFGFDYLRDNMKVHEEGMVQREHHYSIVDEVDSILIDEARTPLIISGPTDETTDKYNTVNRIIPFLKKEVHFTVDEKAKTAHLTDEGVEQVQQSLRIENLYDPRYINFLHHVDQALKAHVLFKRDTDYVVKDNQVIIVDEFTGRLMPGRRFSDGLHQALEAKEGVDVANENQTLASITFQNYFRLYKKLAGMTGTADTEAEEFESIYKLPVTVIPTHMPMIREDNPDIVFKNERAKYRAIAKDIRENYERGQPVLVGTVSIEKSERLSSLLKKEGIKHVVLNAKQHEKEAHIIAHAGEKGSITIATNMAGRGTDIVLGPGVIELGGLYILGTERHEARRIDNQLRGRAGRQGDPGKSRFYLSLEDDLLRIFAGDRMLKVMEFLGMEEDEPIEARMISKAIEDAQTRVEARNFDIRKHLLKYDNVMNYQRKIVYSWRRKLLSKDNVQDDVNDLNHEVLELIFSVSIPPKAGMARWNWDELKEGLIKIYDDDLGIPALKAEAEAGKLLFARDEDLFEIILKKATEVYKKKETELTPEIMRKLERTLLLHTLDDRWKEHLLDMDHLREGINLRGYAQKDPALDYQKESFRLFENMFALVKEEFLCKLYRIRLRLPDEAELDFQRQEIEQEIEQEQMAREERARKLSRVSGGRQDSEKSGTIKRDGQKVGRNDPCPCGSGKKYKKCHGRASASG